jgi:hypothetical protein
VNRGVDCKDTTYEITFPSCCESSLTKLSHILEALLVEEYVRVHTSGSISSLIITIYEELE